MVKKDFLSKSFHRSRVVVLHSADDDGILVFSKSRRHLPDGQYRAPAGVVVPGEASVFPGVPDASGLAASLPGSADTLIVVLNCDPHAAREATVSLDLAALDLDPKDLDSGGRFEVEDLITGARWRWGADNYVRLDPAVEPAHVLKVVRRS